MTTYLIDYENVREDGLTGLLQLPSDDRVIIFYTAENERISLKWFAGTKATLSAVKVAPGAQSLDKHLVSYLGFLAGCEAEPDSRYVVVSRDNGYKSLAAFWNERLDSEIKVSVRPQIKEEAQEKQPEPAEEKAAQIKPVPVKPVQAEPAQPVYTHEDMKLLASKVLKIISETGSQHGDTKCMLMSTLCDTLASDPVYRFFRAKSSFKASSFVRRLSNEIVIRRENSNVWVAVKAPVQAEETGSEVSPLITKLTESGLSAEEAEGMAELIEQLRSDGKNIKQRVYRESLRRFQKERGLNAYNSVKSLL